MLHSLSDHAAFPPHRYVAVSVQHLRHRLRFLVPGYLVNLLNQLKLNPFQLTPNSYFQLTSLALVFLRNELEALNPHIYSHLYSLKGVASPKGGARERIYYLTARKSDYKSLLPKGLGKTSIIHAVISDRIGVGGTPY